MVLVGTIRHGELLREYLAVEDGTGLLRGGNAFKRGSGYVDESNGFPVG